MPDVACETIVQSVPPITIPKRRCFSLTVKDFIKICATVVIPLIFGLFTVVVTLYQQRIAQQQRSQDLEIAQQQRVQDLELAQQQRAEDRKQAELLRKQDFELAELRRKQELNISIIQAEATRRRHNNDLMLADNLQKESVLVGYLKEMADLLDLSKFDLDEKSRVSIVRPKTLSVLRQLDPQRKTHLIRFLYESDLITAEKNPLDLSGADLDGIDLSFLNLRSIALKSVIMRKSRFIKSNLSFSNLKDSVISDSNFSMSIMLHSNFVRVKATNAYFSSITSVKLNMSGIHANEASFREANLHEADFFKADLRFTDFTNASVTMADFQQAMLENSTITKEQLETALPDHKREFPLFNVTAYKNLILNGNAEKTSGQDGCPLDTKSLKSGTHWRNVKGGYVFALNYQAPDSPKSFIPNNTLSQPNECYFTGFTNDSNQASVFQTIDLKQYTRLIKNRDVTFVITALMGVNRVGLEMVSVNVVMKTIPHQTLSDGKNMLRNGDHIRHCGVKFEAAPETSSFEIHLKFERLNMNIDRNEFLGCIDDVQLLAVTDMKFLDIRTPYQMCST